jgi:predicted esterase
MMRKAFTVLAVLMALACMTRAQEDAAPKVPTRKLEAGGGDPHMRYFLIGPKEEAPDPKAGYALVVALAGDEGQEQSLEFLQRLAQEALGEDYLVALLVPPRWTPEQEVLWPTARVKAAGAEFYTEDFVEAVVKDVGAKHRFDASRIYALGWSEGGFAAYTAALQEEAAVTGALVAMADFKPHLVPPFRQAKGRAFFIYHSPEDEVFPARMARAAELILRQNEAEVLRREYEGGHGWPEEACEHLRQGIKWLESVTIVQAENGQQPEQAAAQEPKDDKNLIIFDGFENGRQVPQGWERGTAFPGDRYRWEGGARSGRLCIGITRANTTIPAAYAWSRSVKRKPGGAYLDVSGWLKANRADQAGLEVRYKTVQGRKIHTDWAFGVTRPSQPWTRYEERLAIPPRTSEIEFALVIYGAGTVWMDDLEARVEMK